MDSTEHNSPCVDKKECSSRVLYMYARKYEYGVITAYRYAPDCGEITPYTRKENQQRNKSLLSKLRARGYSVTSIEGSYIENYGTPNAREVGVSSFFVADVQSRGTLLNDLKKFGREFDQDCILFGRAGSANKLVGTNTCPDGYPGMGKEVRMGAAIFGKDSEFMSIVRGRPFVFSEDMKTYGVAKYPSELRGPVMQSEKDWNDLDV